MSTQQSKPITLFLLFLVIVLSCSKHKSPTSCICGSIVRLTTDLSEDRCPAWSPDSKEIVYVSSRTGEDNIWTISSDGLYTEQITSNSSSMRYPSFSPDGNLIAYASDGIYLVSKSGGAVEKIFSGECRHPSFSPVDEQIVFESGGNIYVLDAISYETTCIISKTSDMYDIAPCFSNEGSKVAFTSARAGNYDIWIKDVNGGNEIQLTFDSSFDGHPSWSPDGSRIVFVSNRDGWLNLWIKYLVDGKIIQLTNTQTLCIDPAWSFNGDEIAFVSSEEIAFSANQDYWWAEEMPELIHYAVPSYPDSARIAGIEGTVILSMRVNIDGKADSTHIAKVDPPGWGFEEASLEASRKFLFTPAFQYYIPVRVWVSILLRFEIHGQPKVKISIEQQPKLSGYSANLDIYLTREY